MSRKLWVRVWMDCFEPEALGQRFGKECFESEALGQGLDWNFEPEVFVAEKRMEWNGIKIVGWYWPWR